MLRIEPSFVAKGSQIALAEVVIVYDEAGLETLRKALRATPKGGWTILGDVHLSADGTHDPADGVVLRLLRRGG